MDSDFMAIVGLRSNHPNYDDDLAEATALEERFAAAKRVALDRVVVLVTYPSDDEFDLAILEAVLKETLDSP